MSTSASRPSAGEALSPSAGRNLALSTGELAKSAYSFTWPMPCKLATSMSSAPRPSLTTAPSSCRGRTAQHGCRPTAPLSASPNEARTSPALKAELTALAAEVDAGFPANIEFSVDAGRTPHLKQLATTEQPAGLREFEQEIRAACRSAISSTSSSTPSTGPATPATRLRSEAGEGCAVLPVHRVRLRLQSRSRADRPTSRRDRLGAGAAPNQRAAHQGR